MWKAEQRLSPESEIGKLNSICSVTISGAGMKRAVYAVAFAGELGGGRQRPDRKSGVGLANLVANTFRQLAQRIRLRVLEKNEIHL